MGHKRIDYCGSFLFCGLEKKSTFHKEISALDSWSSSLSRPLRLHSELNGLEKTLISCS